MTIELIYKTETPAIVDWYRELTATTNAEGDARLAYADSLTEEIGSDEKGASRTLWVMRGWSGETRVVGIAANDADRTNPPVGLRYDKKKGYLVPALKVARGKKFAAEFAALEGKPARDELNSLFGVPSSVMGSDEDRSGNVYMYHAGFEFDTATGVLYMVWGSGRVAAEVEKGMAKHPEIIWARVPRSEWYAREESKAASK